jgi:hypothetical protein
MNSAPASAQPAFGKRQAQAVGSPSLVSSCAPAAAARGSPSIASSSARVAPSRSSVSSLSSRQNLPRASRSRRVSFSALPPRRSRAIRRAAG